MQPDNRQSSEHTLERAAQLFREGDLEAAINLYAKILRHDSNHAAANLQVGIAAQAFGKSVLAEKHFRTATKSAPHDSRALVALVQLLIEQHRLGEAARILEQAIAVVPDLTDGHHWLGRVRHLQMDFFGATEALNHAASIAPEDGEIHFHLGRALAEIGTHSAKAAQAPAAPMEPVREQGFNMDEMTGE